MIKILSIRNGSWILAPVKYLRDHGTYYQLNLLIFNRRIYKSSIDKEIELHILVGFLLLPVIIVGWTILLLLRLYIMMFRWLLARF